jgi:hypothetical protein
LVEKCVTVVVVMATMEKTRMTRRTMRKKTLLAIGGIVAVFGRV